MGLISRLFGKTKTPPVVESKLYRFKNDRVMTLEELSFFVGRYYHNYEVNQEIVDLMPVSMLSLLEEIKE